MKALKIGFAELAPALRVGGLEEACRGLETALRDKGHEVFSCDNAQSITEQQPDIVHFHGIWSHPHKQMGQLCQERGIATVVSPHGMLEPWARKTKRWKKLPYFHLFEKQHLNRAHAVLATAEQEGERLRALIGKAPVKILPLGSHFQFEPDYQAARKTLDWANDQPTLLYLSRIHKKKGLLQLLQALQAIREKVPANTKLVIVGEGPDDYVAQCKAAAQSLESVLTIEWLPAIWSDQKWAYIQGADLMCLPTFSENFGIIVLEACQVGTRVLTTVETPWLEIGERGLGWVVKPEVSAYAEALTAFFANSHWPSEQRNQLSQWARDSYSWSNLAERYVAFYQELIDQNK